MLLILLAACTLAQTGATKYEWKATLRAVDESGNPIGGANAEIGYYTNSQPVNAEGITDTNGMFTASHSALATMVEVSCQAEKPGYYTTWVRRELGPKYDPAQWFFTQTLVLKQIEKPIAMYAKSTLGLKLPEYSKRIGYDLMIGDWIGPYGKGTTSDILFEKNYTNVSSREYYSKVTVTFPKNRDGIQIYSTPDLEAGSSFRSPHEAPAEGYQPQLIRETTAHPGQPSKFEYDPSRIYLFRVRTVLDERGNVKSALYGKIYGDFMQFSYYLNPTPNDRNIEFDPKHNLLRGLQPVEEVTSP